MINAQNGNAQTAHLDPCVVPPPPPAREINMIETYIRNWHEKSNFSRKEIKIVVKNLVVEQSNSSKL